MDNFVSNNHVSYVDFDDDDNTNKIEEPQSLYVRNGKKILFDDKTMNYYKAMRYRKMDPIYLLDVDETKCFKFYHQWNPYNGERLDIDPYGPLCFHPDSLIKYFYENRLNNLWVNESQHNGVYYHGYYDDAVGAGPDIYIHSRGSNPEKYLFRLPIIDCYWLTDFQNEIVVTMGPMLTLDEIKEIDDLAKNCGNHYKSQYGANRPSLLEMKLLYDTAIAKEPSVITSDSSTNDELLYAQTNRMAVDKLRKMKG